MDTDYLLPTTVYNATLITMWAQGINPGRPLLPENEPHKPLDKEIVEKAINAMSEQYINQCGAALLKYKLDGTIPSKDSFENLNTAKELIQKFLMNAKPSEVKESILLLEEKFKLTSREQKSILNIFSKEQKQEQKKAKAEEEKALVSFGDTADKAAEAIAVLTEDFKELHAPVFNLSKQLYVYNGRIYESDDTAEAEIKNFIYNQARKHGIHITPNNVKHVMDRIKDENTINAESLASRPERVVVENGILDVLTGELYDHDPNERHITELNIRYDPTVPISEDFENYLKTTFNGVEWEIDLFQEMLGYCLLREYRFEVFFFLIGNGGNGRTTATNLINKFLGDRNVSSKNLQEICNPSDSYSLMGLHGKLANICGETGVKVIDDFSNLKKVTGRDKIEARLPYHPWVRFYNYAKMIFSMNQVPLIKDSTRGRRRRMKIIDFQNSFFDGIDADKTLESKLTQPESLTGILNWALKGLQRLLKNGEFSDIRSEAQIAIEFDRKCNPVKHFVLDHIDKVGIEAFNVSRVTFSQILEAYTQYMKKYNLPSLDIRALAAQVKYECEQAGIVVKQGRDRYEKGKTRQDFFRGIVLCDLEALGLSDPKNNEKAPLKEPETLTEENRKMEAELTQRLEGCNATWHAPASNA